MYPSLPKQFMIKYTEATKRSYGYLFIDIKQNTHSGRGVKRSMSYESYKYTFIPPNMDSLTPQQRVKSLDKTLTKATCHRLGQHIERRHEFERQGDKYVVANSRAVNHFLHQLRKELRKRIVELYNKL